MSVKWKIKTPQPGDKRIVRRFAWFPVEIEGYKVWLETYETKEEYRKVMVESYNGLYYRDYRWVEISTWDQELEKLVYPARKLLHYWV